MIEREHSKKTRNPFQLELSDEDIYDAMKQISGYLDITPGDFKEIYGLAFQHALNRFTRAVEAKDVMNPDVVVVTQGTLLKEVAETMGRHGISGFLLLMKAIKWLVLSPKRIFSPIWG